MIRCCLRQRDKVSNYFRIIKSTSANPPQNGRKSVAIPSQTGRISSPLIAPNCPVIFRRSFVVRSWFSLGSVLVQSWFDCPGTSYPHHRRHGAMQRVSNGRFLSLCGHHAAPASKSTHINLSLKIAPFSGKPE